MKSMIKKIVTRLFPELNSKTHLPHLGVVISVPDPPISGEQHTHERPYYAVDVRLLNSAEEIDEDMPLLRDIPVAMTGSAPLRGFAALPQPGTIVEVAFAFGMQSKPFIRSVLPWKMKLPAIDAESQRWQQTATSYQEVDANGNWNRITDQTISDTADINCNRTAKQKINDTAAVTNQTSSTEHTLLSPQIYIGNESDNTLKLDSDFMNAVISAFNTLASHTHPDVGTISQGSAVSSQATAITALKTKLDAITKT